MRTADVVCAATHAELGELIAGDREGRTDDAWLTLYKSVGVAVQDAAAAVAGPGEHTGARCRNSFTGGTIKRVAVDVSGEPYINLEREAVALLLRE